MRNLLPAGPNSDRRSMLIAGLCFAHCVAGPALLSFAGWSSLVSTSEKLEPVFLVGSAATGLMALVPAYRTKHGRASCLALFATGFACLLLRQYAASLAVPLEGVIAGVGASLMIGAHVLNLRLSLRCACCDSAVKSAQTPAIGSSTSIGK
jgi:hypothetical protein